MKVVLFCGGLGMRMRRGDQTESLPKPLVPIGYRPILWHLMRYYAHHGHKDFILCLGYRADAFKSYFLSYDECLSNDFVLSQGGRDLTLMNRDIQDWRITFADTGVDSNIGERLMAVEKYLEREEMFLANYADGLSDLPLEKQIEDFRAQGKVASFVSVTPSLSYHIVSAAGDGLVSAIEDMQRSRVRINGGFFAFKRDIFKYLKAGEELVREPFQRLITEKQLVAYPYDGFWVSMDTFKDKQRLDEIYARGKAPWEMWKGGGSQGEAPRPRPVAPAAEKADWVEA